VQRDFATFIGVDLGGGKGKKTAVAVLRRHGDGVRVDRYDAGAGGHAWYDERLIAFLLDHADDAVVAIDAPLSLPACVRCREPVCPGVQACVDPTVVWFRDRAERADKSLRGNGAKPHYTPYTQRATEVVLHDEGGILPRETLGQGMGPLTARAAHLIRALAGRYRLNHNLIEVYPKATVWRLFGEQTARSYKKHHAEQDVRLMRILHQLPHLTFGPGQWKEFGVQKDHLFDAVICAYTGWLWARDGWQLPDGERAVFDADGWIFAPPDETAAK
jgi:predicted RNase H-like nuclease